MKLKSDRPQSRPPEPRPPGYYYSYRTETKNWLFL